MQEITVYTTSKARYNKVRLPEQYLVLTNAFTESRELSSERLIVLSHETGMAQEDILSYWDGKKARALSSAVQGDGKGMGKGRGKRCTPSQKLVLDTFFHEHGGATPTRQQCTSLVCRTELNEYRVKAYIAQKRWREHKSKSKTGSLSLSRPAARGLRPEVGTETATRREAAEEVCQDVSFRYGQSQLVEERSTFSMCMGACSP